MRVVKSFIPLRRTHLSICRVENCKHGKGGEVCTESYVREVRLLGNFVKITLFLDISSNHSLMHAALEDKSRNTSFLAY